MTAVLDDGLDLQHEDIVNKLFRDGGGAVIGSDETDQGDNSPQPNAWDPHGTACAGLIAAETNNGKGVAGVCWNCRLMPVQLFYNLEDLLLWPTSSFVFSDQWSASGIDFAWQNGADIISMSWKTNPNMLITDAIQRAATQGRSGKGCVLVAASGNDQTNSVSYPANLDDHVIAVGATDENDLRWWYSNYGSSLDVVAPSGNTGILEELSFPDICLEAPPHHNVAMLLGSIWTTEVSGSATGYNLDVCRYAADSPRGDSQGHYTAKFSGTSAATPQVAGLAALILSINPDLTRSQVQDIIQDSADDVPAMGGGYHIEYGHGRINAYAALKHTLENYGGALSGEVTITETLKIQPGNTLTILPGTTVRFRGSTTNLNLQQGANLVAVGTASEPILFTSADPNPGPKS